MVKLLPYSNKRQPVQPNLITLWAQAEEMGAIRVWQNGFNGLYHVDLEFWVGKSEVKASGGEFQKIEQALDDVINTAVMLGAANDDARNRKRI